MAPRWSNFSLPWLSCKCWGRVASSRLSLRIAFCCSGVAWLLAHAVPAATPTDPKQANVELTQLRSRIDSLQSQLKATRAQEPDRVKSVREIEQRIGTLNAGVREVATQVRDGERQLDALQTQYAASIAKLERERRALGQQLRGAYLHGRQEQVKLVLNQEDPARFGRMLEYYRYLNQARISRIQEVEGALVEIDALQQRIDTQRVSLTETQAQQADEISALAEERKKRESLLGKLQSEIRSQGDQLSQMQKDEKRLGELIKGLQKALAEVAEAAPKASIAPNETKQTYKGGPQRSFAKLKKTLPWPVSGKLKAGFGDRRELGELRWRGAFIAAPANREVHAVAHGRVAFADWLRGFGLLIIIDHGDEYMTLYGHNQALYKAVGERVAPGDVIASVGDTGGMDRHGVYFELRYKGEPQNPQLWCAGKPDAVQAKR